MSYRCHPRKALAAGVATSLLVFMLPMASADRGIEVKNAWARSTVPGQTVGGVYLEVSSAEPARIVGVRSTASKSAEIHSLSMDGGMMKMRRLEKVDLPPGEIVRLAPGGNHIMLLNLKQPLVAGERVPVTLIVS